MNVLSLFDGCSGGRLSLVRANKKIDKYYTCEIDKYSSMVTKLNFPDTIALGDITKVNFEMLPKINFLIGGSPCQDLSFSKANGKGLEGERSGLFYKYFEALEVLRKKNPEIKFLLENVKMKKEWKDIISDLLGVQPIFINSADFSAQNRQRLYWTNIPVDEWIPCEDKLQDILEDGQVNNPAAIVTRRIDKDGKRKDYDKTVPKVQTLEAHEKDKSRCLSTVSKDTLVSPLPEGRYPLSKCIQVGEADIKGRDSLKRVYSPKGKSPTLTTCGGGHREPKVSTDNKTWRKLSVKEAERLQTVPDDYTRWGLKTTYKDIKETDAEDRYYYSPKMLAWIDRHGKRKNKKLRIQSDDDKVQMIEASHFKGCSSQRFFAIEDKKGLRYITITETERAQTVPDRYTKCGQKETGEIVELSNTQRYKMLGNGFTINVIAHIIKNL
jgi:DNA-cytosine methyltransferase